MSDEREQASRSMSEQNTEAGIVPSGPCAIVIFGARGVLTKRLPMPALYDLDTSKLLPESYAVVGVEIDEMDTAAFREQLARDQHEHNNILVSLDSESRVVANRPERSEGCHQPKKPARSTAGDCAEFRILFGD